MENSVISLGSSVGDGSTTSVEILERVFYLDDDVCPDTVMPIISAIQNINKSDEYLKTYYSLQGLTYTPRPIELYISSYGGSVYDGFALMGAMTTSKIPVHTIVTGKAMSMGFMIAISGHRRFAHKFSSFMYHQISSMAWGKLAEMEDSVEECIRLQKMVDQQVIDCTLITLKKLTKINNKKQDWYMGTDEALDLGIIDGIV